MLIRHLPAASSALYRVEDPEQAAAAGWSLTDHLLDDLRMAVQYSYADRKSAAKIKPHQSRPDTKAKPTVRSRRRDDPGRVAQLDAARQRARARQVAIDRGEIA